jgi:hypothetical protein
LVLGGTLQVNSPGSLPAGSDVVVSAGTLGGSGTINGHVYLEGSGSISPGDPLGTLYITGGLDLFNQAAGTGKLLFDLAGPADPQDRISISSHLELGDGVLGFSDFVFTDLGGLQAGIYKLITSGEIPAQDSLDPNDLTGMIGSLPASLRISSDRKDLELVINAGYTSWAAGPFQATLDDDNPALDFDNGGLATALEWVLGGDPTDPGDDAGIAPTLDPTSDPDGKVLCIFRRSNASNADANTAIAVQYGSDLDGWTSAVHQGTDANQITIREVPDSPGFSQVTVALPANLAASGRLFARLKVEVAAP